MVTEKKGAESEAEQKCPEIRIDSGTVTKVSQLLVRSSAAVTSGYKEDALSTGDLTFLSWFVDVFERYYALPDNPAPLGVEPPTDQPKENKYQYNTSVEQDRKTLDENMQKDSTCPIMGVVEFVPEQWKSGGLRIPTGKEISLTVALKTPAALQQWNRLMVAK